MIRINTIHIEDFRGIRALDLDLGGKNFGICGPNGTGKSGVVDAIEFCLTGDITRLSGQGSAGLSVKNHAPHVDQRAHPEKANITITGDIPSIGKTFQIHRSVKSPMKAVITPNDEDTRRIVAELETHPEFALSRREIVKYIITPSGQRSIDVQTLLRLDHIERLRKSFTTFYNKCKGEAEESARNYHQAGTDLKNILKIDKLDPIPVLGKVNERRQVLGLPDLTELTDETSFKSGVAAPQEADKKTVLRKAVMMADLDALQAALRGAEPGPLVGHRQAAKQALETLSTDETALSLARRHGFIKIGIELVEEDACPLCGAPWEADKLREYLRKRILSAAEIESTLLKLQTNINAVLMSIAERIQAIERVILYSKSLNPPAHHIETANYLAGLKAAESALKDFLADHSQVAPALKAVTDSWWSPLAAQRAEINECQVATIAMADTSSEDEARDILSVAQDRHARFIIASRIAGAKEARCAVAQKVLDLYISTAKTVLERIYDQVSADFCAYYRAINREDEDGFTGKLIAESAKLGFDVDFYGRGLFPPGAYHSEGHQDAMGLCLYLALMKHTLGDKFTFAVLDDVLMSVDSSHRREVCSLLKREFPTTQFILTSHDPIWLRHMKTEGLIVGKSAIEFRTWSVDLGPTQWDDRDVWTQINGHLRANDVRAAAALLRHYLEYASTELCHRLRAPVGFRGDARYQLGELLPPAIARIKKLFKSAKDAAGSWNQRDVVEQISARSSAFDLLVQASYAEQWQVNIAVHYNNWDNLTKEDFTPVAVAFQNLIGGFTCSDCSGYLRVSPDRETPEAVRCECGKININLRKKDT